jgi:hypothetical protein
MEINLFWDENLEPVEQFKELCKRFPADWEWNPSNPNRIFSNEREYNLSYMSIAKNFRVDFGLGYPDPQFRTDILWTKACNPIMNGEMSVSQAVSLSKDAAQSIIDSFEN